MPVGLMALATGPFPNGGFISDWLWEISLRRDAVGVPLKQLPKLVRFRDRFDRDSVEHVAPSDLAKAFGPDVRLIQSTVQIVPSGYWPFNLLNLGVPQWLFGMPITEGLEHLLPWLQSWMAEEVIS
jgi:hypothetical protein